MNSNDAVALVTGAARGIGTAIAARLARDGRAVAMLDVDPAVVQTARGLQEQGCRVRPICLDIADRDSVLALPDHMQDWWPRLAILVNNAGISPKHGGRKSPVADMAFEEWRRVLDVNLSGTFLVTQTCLPALTAHGWGRIVVITSQAARTRTPVPGAHYAATKAGLTGFARVLAAEVAAAGVTVNCVAPGRIESDMTAAVGGELNTTLAQAIPLGRYGTAEEVAGAVAYLASDDASYCTGAIIDVNGGNFMP
jgi:3-oxoacyl-[acyl-carrier protein] reductase